jgi:precorrin-2 dehydrogenase / sirohydrochlorin ferrochelatase
MLPLVLDAARLRVVLAGRGRATLGRLRMLGEAGARDMRVFSDVPEDALRRAAGALLVERLPEPADLDGVDVLFLADLDEATTARLYAMGRRARALVNAEDDKPHCDLHVPAVVRRGDLLLTVSTGGRSPGLAVRLKRRLEALFGPEWAGRLDEVAAARHSWRARGLPLPELMRRTDSLLAERGWLDDRGRLAG